MDEPMLYLRTITKWNVTKDTVDQISCQRKNQGIPYFELELSCFRISVAFLRCRLINALRDIGIIRHIWFIHLSSYGSDLFRLKSIDLVSSELKIRKVFSFCGSSLVQVQARKGTVCVQCKYIDWRMVAVGESSVQV